MLAVLGESVVIVGVLAFEMQDGETWYVGIFLPVLHYNLVIVAKYSGVKLVKPCIAHVKLRLAE